MTSEEKLKELILSKHSSILEFTQKIGMPYGTIQSIFKRGIQNSSVTNIIKICDALGISADALAQDQIIFLSYAKKDENELTHMILRANIKRQSEAYTLDGELLTEEEWETLLHFANSTIEYIRKTRKEKQ